MERNIKLLIAYDGTNFHGWQRQPGLRTVQGELESAARRVLRHEVNLRGSGRTDAGVHARGQVANFKTTTDIPADNLRRAIGSRLPLDICVRHAQEVHPDFDSVSSAVSKLYRYRVHNTPHRPTDRFSQRYCYHYWHKLDVERMRAGARAFVGTMDFSSMAAAGCVRESMVRTVLRCDVHAHLGEVRVDVQGKGFLYNQVRIMVGTLLEVGRGHWPVERVAEILAACDRNQAGPTVPPQGLSMQWVEYPASLLRPLGVSIEQAVAVDDCGDAVIE